MEEVARRSRISLSNVLIATDFSSASQSALFYALSIARRYGATLYLAHIVRPDTFGRGSDSNSDAVETAWREGQRLTTDLLVSGHLQGLAHKLIVGQGEIWEGLAPLIKEHSIDLLVLGTRGRSGLSKMLLGSVAELIFRQAPCPVLTVGPHSGDRSNQTAGLGRILYATDFTPQSSYAFDYALSLAQQYQAQLTLLHVSSESSAEPSGRKGDGLIEAESQLRALIPPDIGLSAAPDLVVTSGVAAERILAVSSEKKPDLIVLGVHQPASGTFAGRRWTTASEVTANAACPVLTVRAPE